MAPELLFSKKEAPPFQEIYEKYYFCILNYTCKKVPVRQDAEDLVSDAFLYGYQHYSEYDPEKSSVQTWLYLILNSRIKNYYRDTRRPVDIDELENVLHQDDDSLDDAVYLENVRRVLADALETLPRRQRDIVIKRYFQEKSSGQIAEEMGLSPGNVRVLLSRALDRLEELCGTLL